MSYKNTSLWKNTLGSVDVNVKPLRDSFIQSRKNAEILLNKIRIDFPELTIHDITHVDSLWNVADTIIGENYPINPLEGYILGIAFLIHDAVLSYDAIGGIDALRDTIEWKDAYSEEHDIIYEEEFKKVCDFITIRSLHAKKAESILDQLFKRDNGTTFYIIDDDNYRKHYGTLIGQIAASHHWSIDEVESRLKKQINPRSSMPRDWKINAQKLACVLRCADAGHIDDGRAPDCIFQTLNVNGVSRNHWESQNHLCQVCEDNEDSTMLCITSSNPFKKEDFAAWNVAYEAVKIFNKELKSSNNLLKTDNLDFPFKGVSGAESKETMSKYIETDGWQPCSFGIHTSNVKAMIESLGGNKLYGKENPLFVTLRELIQNASDAIRARRMMDNSFVDERITIRLKEIESKYFLEIVDNGIGMSIDCIKHHLLDFGSSYWKSSLSRFENPGLRSSGFKSIGDYGIGFYSVFMVSNYVEVLSKRYDKGVADAKKIEFPSGLTLFPILSDAALNPNESTIVRFEIKEDICLSFDVKNGDSSYPIPLNEILSIITVGLNVDVNYEHNGVCQLIHENINSRKFDKKRWLADLSLHKISDEELENIVENLEIIRDKENNIKALIAISDINKDTTNIPFIETICGLATSLDIFKRKGFIGFINGKSADVSRNSFRLDKCTNEILQKWIKDRYNKDYDRIVTNQYLSLNYESAISFFNIANEIEIRNIRNLYANYQEMSIEIGTIKGLQSIHKLIFSGTNPFAGQYRVHEIKFYPQNLPVVQVDDLEESLHIINAIPENSFKNIIAKFVKVLIVHPFLDGNKRAAQVWTNLMLKKMMDKMIDWEKVNKQKFYDIISYKYNDLDEMINNMCGYLKNYLSSDLYNNN